MINPDFMPELKQETFFVINSDILVQVSHEYDEQTRGKKMQLSMLSSLAQLYNINCEMGYKF